MTTSLSVSRTSIGLVPLVAAGSGHSGAVIQPGWEPGGVDPVNEWSESADLPGAYLARTRVPMVEMVLPLRLYAANEAAVRTLLAAWKQALAQFSYTITESYTGGSEVYQCSPAVVTPAFDGYQLSRGNLLVTCTIPRQP